jgi:hypothetical protein
MARRRFRTGALALAMTLALTLTPVPSEAIAPVLLLMVKQIGQDLAKSMVKDALLSSLSGIGCRGIALTRAIEAFDLRGGGAGALLGGMPKLPAGMSMSAMPGGAALAMSGGLSVAGGIPPEMAAKMGALMPGAGQLPPGLAAGADPMAMMARMQQAMGEPLSPPQTLATIDELFELGFLPKAMQSELKECMVLVPESIPVLGMGMGMFKPMIPQLRQARDQMHALPPDEQDELAAALVQQIKPLPAGERTAFLEQLDAGFFPPRLAQGVKAGLAAR